MGEVVQMSTLMYVAALFVIWSILVSALFTRITARNCTKVIKNLKIRADEQNSEMEKIRSLLTRVSVAFDGLLEKSKKHDKKIRVHRIAQDTLQERIDAIESSIAKLSNEKAGNIVMDGVVHDDPYERPEDELQSHDLALQPHYELPQAPQPRHPQRRGNPTGRVQL